MNPLSHGRSWCLAPAALWAGPAWAAGDAAGGEDRIGFVLLLLGVLAAAYLLTHFVMERLQQRLLLVTGVEYVLLGALLGPLAGSMGSIERLAPAVAFGVGWVGLLVGTRHSLADIQASPRYSLRIAALDGVVTAALITVLGWVAFTAWLDMPSRGALQIAATMACAGAAGSTSACRLLGGRYPQLNSGLLPTLAQAARYTELTAILGIGVLLAVFHDQPLEAPVILGPSDWVLLTMGLGVALGLLFAAFIGDDRSEHTRFLAMVGIICLATGAALFLDLSGIAVNLVLGVVLANSARGRHLHATLERTRKPMVLMLLVLAGVLWTPVPWLEGTLITLGFMAVRLLGKMLGGWLAGSGTPLRGDIGRALMSQGDVALAIALSMRLVAEPSALVDLAFTGIVGSVLAFELLAPRLLKGLLVDAGDLRQDLDLRDGSGGGV